MSDKDEALRLADELNAYHTRSCHKEAAALLRRQHAEIASLKAECDALRAEVSALQSQVNAFYLGTPESRLLAMTKERDALRAELREVTEAMNDPAVNNIRTLAESIRILQAECEALRAALTGLLARDQRNTCQHESTHRGGAIWEICDVCGLKWADDEGGKPEWVDPPEWDAAQAALKEAGK